MQAETGDWWRLDAIFQASPMLLSLHSYLPLYYSQNLGIFTHLVFHMQYQVSQLPLQCAFLEELWIKFGLMSDTDAVK